MLGIFIRIARAVCIGDHCRRWLVFECRNKSAVIWQRSRNKLWDKQRDVLYLLCHFVFKLSTVRTFQRLVRKCLFTRQTFDHLARISRCFYTATWWSRPRWIYVSLSLSIISISVFFGCMHCIIVIFYFYLGYSIDSVVVNLCKTISYNVLIRHTFAISYTIRKDTCWWQS